MAVSQIVNLTDLWLAEYADKTVGLCSLCGNSGVIDTRATAVSAAGVRSGRVNFCICPNGRALKEGGADPEKSYKTLRWLPALTPD
jgi:hypothetical protein